MAYFSRDLFFGFAQRLVMLVLIFRHEVARWLRLKGLRAIIIGLWVEREKGNCGVKYIVRLAPWLRRLLLLNLIWLATQEGLYAFHINRCRN